MDSPEIVYRYFPEMSEGQREMIAALGELYAEWNAKVNVVSRRDIDNLYERHVLHSLAIAKFITPAEGSRILDLGTGGGFPGIPLAIMWPQARLHLIDRIGKKIRVATDIAERIGLTNVTLQHGDSGEYHDKVDFVVSRAVMRLDELAKLSRRNISTRHINPMPNGLICLKGGEMETEMGGMRLPIVEMPVTDYFTEEFFETKKIVYCKL